MEDYKARFANPYTAAERGYIDDVIVPHETRPRLIAALRHAADPSASPARGASTATSRSERTPARTDAADAATAAPPATIAGSATAEEAAAIAAALERFWTRPPRRAAVAAREPRTGGRARLCSKA